MHFACGNIYRTSVKMYSLTKKSLPFLVPRFRQQFSIKLMLLDHPSWDDRFSVKYLHLINTCQMKAV